MRAMPTVILFLLFDVFLFFSSRMTDELVEEAFAAYAAVSY